MCQQREEQVAMPYQNKKKNLMSLHLYHVVKRLSIGFQNALFQYDHNETFFKRISKPPPPSPLL